MEYRFGNCRVSVLTERLLRLEYDESRVFEDRPSQFALDRRFPEPCCSVEFRGGRLALRSDGCHVIIGGGRELENHMECLWDMMRSIPSLELEGASVLDEFYWLNKDDPNYSLRRATVRQGEDAGHEGRFDLPKRAQKDLLRIFLAERA